MSGVRWTATDKQTLRDYWPNIDEIAITTGRTRESIRWMGRTLGLDSPTRATWSQRETEEPSSLQEEFNDVLRRIERSDGPAPLAHRHDVSQHEACLMLSDTHVGAVVKQSIGEYNTDLFLERFNRLERGVESFTALYQATVPVTTLNLFELGDDLEGHGQIYPAQALFMDRNLREQWMIFAERTTRFLQKMLELYEQVNVYKVVGNHGRVGRRGEHHPEDNVESFLWYMIKERFRDEPRIQITVADDFFMLVERLGKLFLLMHGENVRPHSPYSRSGAFNVKLAMNSLIGRVIDYMLVAHHHTPIIIDRELVGETVFNGCFVGPNDLSVRWLHEGNLPSQWFALLHPTYGMIHWSKIKLALAHELRAGLEVHRGNVA